jgi:hypothetical protein
MESKVWQRIGSSTVVFVLVLFASLFRGKTDFLNDPGTFWHLRLGREILRTGSVPRTDFLTWSRADAPWVDQSWLFDAGLAWVVDLGGWSLAVVLTGLFLASLFASLAAWLEREGNSPFVAGAIAIVAASIAAVHFLTRPHLFTFAGILWVLATTRAYHMRGSRWIWAAPVVVGLWANLHGRFVAGPIVLVTATAIEVLGSLGRWDAQRRRRVMTLACVTGASLLAALVNPYGVGLYAHVLKLLVSSGVTDLIMEYQPTKLGGLNMITMELVIVALIALPWFSRRRPEMFDLGQALVWLHFGLSSIRHAPLFGFAVSPLIATLISGVMRPVAAQAEAAAAQFTSGRLIRGLAVPVGVSTGLVVALVAGWRPGGPDPRKWPFEALRVVNQQPPDAAIFHEQDWGGLIESECQPPRRAWMDDRFELWGRKPLVDYIEALKGGPSWDELQEREQFQSAWIRPERGLAKRLAREPGWSELYRDAVSVVYQRGALGDEWGVVAGALPRR